MGELKIAALLCGLLDGGAVEVPNDFINEGVDRSVRVDCETATHVVEVGLDHMSGSRDSVQQAVFAHLLTGKIPVVIIIDTDGKEDRYQFEIRSVAEHLSVPFAICGETIVTTWAMTRYMRNKGLNSKADDFPQMVRGSSECDLNSVFSQPYPG